MGSGSVVVLAEVFDDDASLGESPELLAVETLVAEATVEAFDKTVFSRTGGRDIDRFDVLVREPVLEIMRDKLRAIVGADGHWRAWLLVLYVAAQLNVAFVSNVQRRVQVG